MFAQSATGWYLDGGGAPYGWTVYHAVVHAEGRRGPWSYALRA